MRQCRKCNGVSINIFQDKGDGKCSKCGGSGLGSGLDQFAASVASQRSRCTKCRGSGKCPNCRGKGLV